MKKIVFILVTLLVVLSCNNSKSRFLFDVHEVDFANKSEVTVKGTPVVGEFPLDILDVVVCDSFLIV